MVVAIVCKCVRKHTAYIAHDDADRHSFNVTGGGGLPFSVGVDFE